MVCVQACMNVGMCVGRLWRFPSCNTCPGRSVITSAKGEGGKERSGAARRWETVGGASGEGKAIKSWRRTKERRDKGRREKGAETLRGRMRESAPCWVSPLGKAEILAHVHWTCPLCAWPIYHSVSNTFPHLLLLPHSVASSVIHLSEVLKAAPGQVRTLSHKPKRFICQVQ